MKPARGYESLRGYRVTIPNTSYFLTACTRDRSGDLCSDGIAPVLVAELTAMNADAAYHARAWVIMPDHVHLFFTTGRLTVGQVIARLKAKTGRQLAAQGVQWQGNFYEHRLRPDDSAEDVLRYMFLNPYQAKLVARTEPFRWFWLCEADSAWFRPMLENNRPLPEWLM